MKKKTVITFLALTLVAATSVVGTMAYLTDRDTVVNVFTYGDVNLNLDETKTDEKGNPVDEEGNPIGENETPVRTPDGNTYEMLPGEEYLKDPEVTVKTGSVSCWLFVKLEENGGVTITNGDGSTTTYDFDDYLTYEVAEGWTQLISDTDLDENGLLDNPVEGVYFRCVDEDLTAQEDVFYPVLLNDKIVVQTTVTKDMLNALDNNGQDVDSATYPTLAITAYAVQYSGFEPEVSEGGTEPTAEQTNAAALLAWQAMEEQNTSATP